MMPGTGLGVRRMRVPLWRMVPAELVRVVVGMAGLGLGEVAGYLRRRRLLPKFGDVAVLCLVRLPKAEALP